MTMFASISRVAVLVLFSLAANAAIAEPLAYPPRAIRFVVPFQAGGAVDIMARRVGQYLSERWGQSVVVDNRPGAGGTLGADVVAKAEPDGLTLLVTPQGPLVVNPFLMKNVPYDAAKAFAPVTVIAQAPNVVALSPSKGLKTVAELLSYGKAKGRLTFATQGAGTTGHITGELMARAVGVPMTHVPYKGFPGMLADVTTGRVDMLITDTFNVVPRVRAKELHALAVSSTQRSSVLPEVPTFPEAGYPNVIAGPWFSIVAPAGTPIEIRARLAEAVRNLLKTPEMVRDLANLGTDPVGSTPAEFERFYETEYKRWGEIIRAANITLSH